MRFERTWLLPLLLLLVAPPAFGQGRLQALDVDLGGETVQFAAHPWQGHPAVSAFTRQVVTGAAPQLAVHEVLLDASGWHEAGRWALPPETHYVEPMALPGGVDGWLLLVGTQWQLATPVGDTLERRALCACDTIYSHGGLPDPRHVHFVYDLDGDGTDELLLPYIGYLEAYRIVPGLLAPEPLWRIHWHPDKTPLPREHNPQHGFALPRFAVAAVGPPARHDLIVVQGERALVTPLPPAQGAGAVGMDDARRALFARRAGPSLPDSLSESLRRLGDQRYPSAAAFLDALAQGHSAQEVASWSPFLLRLLTLARSGEAVRTPRAVPLSGLGTFGPKDRALILGIEDMDGDGIPDLLHGKLINAGSVLSQKDELRWYRGRLQDGHLTFAPPTEALRSDAGSFAKLVHLRTDNHPPLALLMASTDVDLGAILKALATQSVTLQASILPWNRGTLATRPLTANTFTYHELKAKGRRAQFLFADLNGDGWRDAILNLNRARLSVFLSHGGAPDLKQPAFVQPGLPLPSRPERVLVADLLGDGHEELVLRFRPDFYPKLGTRLRLLRYVAPASKGKR